MAKMRFNLQNEELGRFYDEMVCCIELAHAAHVEQRINSLVKHPELIKQFVAMAEYNRNPFIAKVRGYYKFRSTAIRSELVPLFHQFVDDWVKDELAAAAARESRPDLY